MKIKKVFENQFHCCHPCHLQRTTDTWPNKKYSRGKHTLLICADLNTWRFQQASLRPRGEAKGDVSSQMSPPTDASSGMRPQFSSQMHPPICLLRNALSQIKTKHNFGSHAGVGLFFLCMFTYRIDLACCGKACGEERVSMSRFAV